MEGCKLTHCPQLTEAKQLSVGWDMQAGVAVVSHTLTAAWGCRGDPVPSHPTHLQAWQAMETELWPLELLLSSGPRLGPLSSAREPPLQA